MKNTASNDERVDTMGNDSSINDKDSPLTMHTVSSPIKNETGLNITRQMSSDTLTNNRETIDVLDSKRPKPYLAKIDEAVEMKDLSQKDLPELKVEDILGDEEAHTENRVSYIAYGTADCLRGK